MKEELKIRYDRLDLVETGKQIARGALEKALAAAMNAGQLPEEQAPDFVVEIPSDVNHGDLAANIALVSAKAFKMAPRKIAEVLVENFPQTEWIDRVEIAGPGFINLFYNQDWFSDVVRAACVCGEEYGRTNVGNGEKVNVEFVSANPTGPMHLGNARGGALGDCLAEAMDWAGYEVCREFYINDAGNQIMKFGKSLAVRYMQIIKGEDAVPFPEDGYQGGDIKVRAQEFFDLYGEEPAGYTQEKLEQAMVDYALPRNIDDMKQHLAKYRIEYDCWFNESLLHEQGRVKETVQLLMDRGEAYEKEGTIWYNAVKHGAEKDEVLVRANGVPTYFAADIAYHADKFSRGFDRAIDIWGADHHGHVARMKGAMDAIGLDGNKLDIVLMQFVRLVRDGQPVRMSKRTGEAITLTDLLDEVPIDSARFFFNLREPGSQIEFDLDLAVAEDSENPVYYVQYANARICSILRNLEGEGVAFDPDAAFDALGLLQAPEEKALIRLVATFPGEIAGAAVNYDPARVTRALIELATGFHKFYTACRVKGEAADLQQARLALCHAAQTVLSNGLGMLKVSVPDKM